MLYKISEFISTVKYAFQRLFRSHGCSDLDLWSLDYHLAKIILPKLIAFKKMNRMGYPATYCEWDEYYGVSKAEWEKFGNIGGGLSAWNNDLDEMIFGFDYSVNFDDTDKSRLSFLKRHGLSDPYDGKDYHLDIDLYNEKYMGELIKE